MRSLTSGPSHLSRFTVLETSPVNEEFQKNFSKLFMQQFTRWKRYTGKKHFEQARIFTYHFYMQHIRAAINFIHLALERGRQSTRSSPESLFAKSFQKTHPHQLPFLLKHEGAEGGLDA